MLPAAVHVAGRSFSAWEVGVIVLAAAMLGAFWLPWFDFFGLVSVSGFDLPRVVHGLDSIASAFGGHHSAWADVAFTAWILPAAAVGCIAQVVRRRSATVPALVAAGLPLAFFGYVLARSGSSMLRYLGAGAWATIATAVALIVAVAVKGRMVACSPTGRRLWVPAAAAVVLVGAAAVGGQALTDSQQHALITSISAAGSALQQSGGAPGSGDGSQAGASDVSGDSSDATGDLTAPDTVDPSAADTVPAVSDPPAEPAPSVYVPPSVVVPTSVWVQPTLPPTTAVHCPTAGPAVTTTSFSATPDGAGGMDIQASGTITNSTGQDLQVAGGELTVTFPDGSTQLVPFDASDLSAGRDVPWSVTDGIVMSDTPPSGHTAAISYLWADSQFFSCPTPGSSAP